MSLEAHLHIASIQLRYTPIVVTQVRSLARAIPPPEPSFMEEGACTDVLSLVQRCASSMDGTISQGGGISLDPGASPLVSPEVEFFKVRALVNDLLYWIVLILRRQGFPVRATTVRVVVSLVCSPVLFWFRELR